MNARSAVAVLLAAIFVLSSISAITIKPAKANGGTQLYIDPPAVNKTPSDVGTTFVENVTIANFTNLAGFDIKLTWDGTVITCISVDYNTTLDILWGAGMYDTPIAQLGVGSYRLVKVALATSASNMGASTLFRMTFHVDKSSTIPLHTLIHFDAVKLSDNSVPVAEPIVAELTDGMYTMSAQVTTVGGYSFLPTNVTSPAHLTAYFALVAMLGLVVSLMKRKRE